MGYLKVLSENLKGDMICLTVQVFLGFSGTDRLMC